ncbi:MAG: phosphatase PAP2 family protein [Sphingomonas sp.]|uniref:phosphatase PAP2 family protein n=1 Tax=Sphingomonas sp. TaxID=28214 RepID=UPI001212DFA4|nr:phosphatase PAP2 family protein [Sphingomonas sp.]THD36148.1 MAG: phosphatase PAP2 family protein [Sphingomonas sp.]
MQGIDASLTHWINAAAGHSPLLDATMIAVATWGVPLLVLLVAVQWWRRSADRAADRHILVAAGLSFLLGLGINQLILLLVHRVRPYDAGVTHLTVAPSADPSFPSDHATAAVAIAVAFLLHGATRRGGAFLVAACVIALSRVFIGIHYVGDTIGGAATALIAALVVRQVYRRGTWIDRFVTGIL